MATDKKAEGLMYKGHPLRRIGNVMYYGSMADSHILMLQVKETKKIDDLEVATKVAVELQQTDPNVRRSERIVKKGEKDSLYAALDVGLVWYARAMSQK